MVGGGSFNNGKVSGNNVSGKVVVEVQGQQLELTLEAKVEGDKMVGTLSGAGIGSIPITAMKSSNAAKTVNSTSSIDINGKWTTVVDAGGQMIDVKMDFAQKGSEFTGALTSSIAMGTFKEGKITGKNVSSKLVVDVQGQQLELTLQGAVEGDKLIGTLSGDSVGTIPFTATKSK